MTDERVIAAHVPGRPSTCPVTEIDGWFWRSLDTRRVLASGMLSGRDVDVATYAEVDIVGAEVDRAREHRRKMHEAQSNAVSAARGSSGSTRRSHPHPGRFS